MRIAARQIRRFFRLVRLSLNDVQQLPDLLTLDFAEHDFKLSIRPGSWMQSGSCQWGTCQLPDPLGALRSWLHHLAAIEAVPTWTANRNGPGSSQSS